MLVWDFLLTLILELVMSIINFMSTIQPQMYGQEKQISLWGELDILSLSALAARVMWVQARKR